MSIWSYDMIKSICAGVKTDQSFKLRVAPLYGQASWTFLFWESQSRHKTFPQLQYCMQFMYDTIVSSVSANTVHLNQGAVKMWFQSKHAPTWIWKKATNGGGKHSQKKPQNS